VTGLQTATLDARRAIDATAIDKCATNREKLAALEELARLVERRISDVLPGAEEEEEASDGKHG